MKKIYFLSESKIRGQYFSTQLDSADFKDEMNNLKIKLIPNKEDHKDIKVQCLSEVEVSEEQFDVIDAYLNGKYLVVPSSPISLPYHRFRIEEEEVIDEYGNIQKGYMFPLNLFPKSIQTICEDIRQLHNEKVYRFLKLLRWQQNIKGYCELLESPLALYWKTSLSQKNYHHVPNLSSIIELPMQDSISWKDSKVGELISQWSEGMSEPLAHELLREAEAIINSSPRSALLILCSGLETAVKQHIYSKIPDTQWLMESFPSPPIFKILKDYIPQLHIDKGLNFSSNCYKNLMKTCQKMIEVRNKVAHIGQPLGHDELKEYMRCTRNVLYILDALEGKDWARNNIDYLISRDLGWDVEKKEGSGMTIIMHGGE